MTRSALSYQKWPIIVTVIGLTLSGWLGWVTTGTLSGLIGFLIIGGILAALEIALSFDNAIVNANKLVEMTPIWQRRFLTWGILIAVFGMRIIFPLAIVAIFAWINPFAAMHFFIPARALFFSATVASWVLFHRKNYPSVDPKYEC